MRRYLLVLFSGRCGVALAQSFVISVDFPDRAICWILELQHANCG
jgi:hypothetical protein